MRLFLRLKTVIKPVSPLNGIEVVPEEGIEPPTKGL